MPTEDDGAEREGVRVERRERGRANLYGRGEAAPSR